jgi:hypothetical protein
MGQPQPSGLCSPRRASASIANNAANNNDTHTHFVDIRYLSVLPALYHKATEGHEIFHRSSTESAPGLSTGMSAGRSIASAET